MHCCVGGGMFSLRRSRNRRCSDLRDDGASVTRRSLSASNAYTRLTTGGQTDGKLTRPPSVDNFVNTMNVTQLDGAGWRGTDKNIRLILRSWPSFDESFLNAIAVDIFRGIFEALPNAQQMFPKCYTGHPWRSCVQFLSHGRAIVDALDDVVCLLDDPTALTALLRDLGGMHVDFAGRGFTVDLLKHAAAAITLAVTRQVYSGIFVVISNRKKEKTLIAWSRFVQYLIDEMAVGYYEALVTRPPVLLARDVQPEPAQIQPETNEQENCFSYEEVSDTMMEENLPSTVYEATEPIE